MLFSGLRARPCCIMRDSNVYSVGGLDLVLLPDRAYWQNASLGFSIEVNNVSPCPAV